MAKVPNCHWLLGRSVTSKEKLFSAVSFAIIAELMCLPNPKLHGNLCRHTARAKEIAVALDVFVGRALSLEKTHQATEALDSFTCCFMMAICPFACFLLFLTLGEAIGALHKLWR
jgi:hypothetical protein